MKVAIRGALIVCVIGIAASPLRAQHGRVVVDTVRSESLKNLFGSPPQARVSVYLPPSYDSTKKRYPVVYVLHGFLTNDIAFMRYTRSAMDAALDKHATKEMILVVPNANNVFGGSFYVNSMATGQWDDFVSRDLVRWVDQKYRTIAKPASRGIAGHSMGGFGAMYLAMLHGGAVFGALYALSPCCTGPDPNMLKNGQRWDTLAAVTVLPMRVGFYPQVTAALGAAFAPDSTHPPLFLSPEVKKEGDTWVADQSVVARWNAHTPLLMVASHRASLLKLRGIKFDIGQQDELVDPIEMVAMDSALKRARVLHSFEIYEGSHTDHIPERMGTSHFPFFSRTLAFEQPHR